MVLFFPAWSVGQEELLIVHERKTENDLKKVFPRETWSKIHLQIIFYGREFCTARGCRGLVCEICTTLYPNRKNPPQINKA